MTCSTDWPGSRVCVAASNWSGPRPSVARPRTQWCGFSTTTPTTRPRSARPWPRSAPSLEQSGSGRLLVVFQPHLYSRTKAFAAEFGHALSAADQVFVLDVYGAREQPLAGVSGATVAENVSVPVALPAGLLGGRARGGRGGRSGRRHRHDGCGRRDPAGSRDRHGAAGAGHRNAPEPEAPRGRPVG